MVNGTVIYKRLSGWTKKSMKTICICLPYKMDKECLIHGDGDFNGDDFKRDMQAYDADAQADAHQEHEAWLEAQKDRVR